MREDRRERTVDAGDTTGAYGAWASGVGRRGETALRRGVVEVSEVTRSGSVVRTAPFRATGGSPGRTSGSQGGRLRTSPPG